MESKIKRGDIYFAALSPVVGSEQGGTRPVVVLQNELGNRHSPTVIVAAITSKTDLKAKLPTHYRITGESGLERDSIILLEQLRTIDKTRLREKVGKLESAEMRSVDKALAVSVGLNMKG
ncbi:MAG: type II toxin-antitoxin system PemK/MazF family toxin [Oscillospiraceae bacterium]|jgi:mRNA interferase MazF|nr:type II toxin-antitoxin system PemK/MazF family toxin [Oscillospiraceae bacterium]